MSGRFFLTIILTLFGVVMMASPAKTAPHRYKILMVVAPYNFRDEELAVPYKKFTQAGMRVTVASTTTGTITGMLKATWHPDILLRSARAGEYDALVFVGGCGVVTLYNNRDALRLARNAAEQHKIIAAICLAPGILAKAGLLHNRRATCFYTAANLLKKGGAHYDGHNDVVQDSNIITANGPKAADRFAKLIIKNLRSGIGAGTSH